jgi:hypothetical protein
MEYCNPGFVSTTWRCYNHQTVIRDVLDWGRILPVKILNYRAFNLGEEVRVKGEIKKVPNNGYVVECPAEEAD